MKPFRTPRLRGFTILMSLAVLLLLGTGLWIIFQNEQVYRHEQQRATRIQAEILAASVTAALDFGDRAAAQEAVDALRVSRRIVMVGVYDAKGDYFAGHDRRQDDLPGNLSEVAVSDDAPIHAYVPIMRSGTKIGTVHLGGAIEPLSRRVARYTIIALLVIMTSIILAVLGLGQTALRRVNQTLAEANRELQFQMEERARAEDQLRAAQKLQALGQLTGGVAHDFNNLLAVIQGAAELLQHANLSEERRMRFTTAIIDASAQGASLTGQLLAFARRQPLKPELLDLHQSISRMRVMLEPMLGPDIGLILDLEQPLFPVEVDPGQFEAALLNVVVNARDAMTEGGKVTIRARNSIDAKSRRVIVSVEDEGAGIPPDQLAQVFEPFFTTKGVGKGTGLGLSQVYGFAAQSGGEAQIDSTVGEGTTLTILLPASDVAQPSEVQAAPPPPAPDRGGIVLLVEDNEGVGDLAESLLKELGHSPLRAHSGLEALQLVDEGATFDIVISDVVMPGMSGLELAALIRQRRPAVPIVLTTGYSDQISTAGSQGFPVVLKPYRMETLARAVDEALTSGLPDHRQPLIAQG